MSPTIRRVVIWSGATLVGLAAVAISSGRGWHWAFCGASPMTFAETDLDHNGKISFIEADYSCNCGSRRIVQDGKQCTEYFAYKDGLSLKVACPAG